MKRRIDLHGKRFGRLIVIGESTAESSNGASKWLCRCDCGTERDIRGTHLRSGITESCGCLGKEKRIAGRAKLMDGKVTTGTATSKLFSLCQREIGGSLVEASELIQRKMGVTSGFICSLIKRGLIHKGGTQGKMRYFADKELADAYDKKAKAERDEYAKGRNERKAQREREKRAQEREAKGLGPYVPPVKKPKKVKLASVKQTKEYRPPVKKQVKVVWPEDVKTKVIPIGVDMRFRFDPPPGWMGEFEREWKELRA